MNNTLNKETNISQSKDDRLKSLIERVERLEEKVEITIKKDVVGRGSR